MAEGEAWIRGFLAEVEGGHSGHTVQLVASVQRLKPQSLKQGPLAILAVDRLCHCLDRESSMAGRNRVLRRWLGENREAVVELWEYLGFPVPPECAPRSRAPPLRLEQLPPEAEARQAAAPPSEQDAEEQQWADGGCRGVVAFDFDQTLTTRHVGVFEDLGNACDRTFGGAGRLALLQGMLEHLNSSGFTVALVTRNSRRVIASILEHVGLLKYFRKDLLFGFEDYNDDVPKSTVLKKQILPALGLPERALLFVDDDGSNIRDVKEHLPQAAMLKAPRTGIRELDVQDILKWAEVVGNQDLRHVQMPAGRMGTLG